MFEFFKSIDLDDSGNIDGFELQQALIKSDVGEYPPWEVEALVSAIDLDKDGKLNLPELSIALPKSPQITVLQRLMNRYLMTQKSRKMRSNQTQKPQWQTQESRIDCHC